MLENLLCILFVSCRSRWIYKVEVRQIREEDDGTRKRDDKSEEEKRRKRFDLDSM